MPKVGGAPCGETIVGGEPNFAVLGEGNLGEIFGEDFGEGFGEPEVAMSFFLMLIMLVPDGARAGAGFCDAFRFISMTSQW